MNKKILFLRLFVVILGDWNNATGMNAPLYENSNRGDDGTGSSVVSNDEKLEWYGLVGFVEWFNSLLVGARLSSE